MDTIKSLLNILKNKHSITKEETPEGFCPNCWGRQEYGGQFFEVAKNHITDIDDKDPQTGWVQEYAEKHLLDIELKHEDDKMVCKKCNLTYRPA